jgi:hypothetical protein
MTDSYSRRVWFVRPAVVGFLILLLGTTPVIARNPVARPSTQPTTQAAPPSIEFLGISAARKAIVDESMEPYFKLLQPMEMSVKTAKPIGGGTLQQQRDECRHRYEGAVQEFSDEEKDALRWYVLKLVPFVAADYPLYARTPWSFIKLSPQFEGGMPHTRGSHIIVSETVLRAMVAVRKQPAPQWIELAQFGDVLLHEQSHVVQREHPDRFAKLYTDLWHFKHATSIQGCQWLTTHQLVNPDGVDVRWVFPVIDHGQKTWIWPLVVFGEVDDPAQTSFADMRMVAIELEPGPAADSFRAKVDAGGKPVMRDLLEVPEYVKLFPRSSNIYHPNEAAADLFAKTVIMADIVRPNAPADSRAALNQALLDYEPLRDWFKRILAADGPIPGTEYTNPAR